MNREQQLQTIITLAQQMLEGSSDMPAASMPEVGVVHTLQQDGGTENGDDDWIETRNFMERFRVSETERQRIEAMARAEGLTKSDLIRRRLGFNTERA